MSVVRAGYVVVVGEAVNASDDDAALLSGMTSVVIDCAGNVMVLLGDIATDDVVMRVRSAAE